MQVIAAGALELWVVRLRCALNCPQIRALGGVLRVFVLFSPPFRRYWSGGTPLASP